MPGSAPPGPGGLGRKGPAVLLLLAAVLLVGVLFGVMPDLPARGRGQERGHDALQGAQRPRRLGGSGEGGALGAEAGADSSLQGCIVRATVKLPANATCAGLGNASTGGLVDVAGARGEKVRGAPVGAGRGLTRNV